MRKSEVILSIVAVLAISCICGAKTRTVEPQRVKKPEARFKKLLSPGVYAELTKQSKREYKKEQHLGGGRLVRAGYYILDTYTLAMKHAIQSTSTTLWRKHALCHEGDNTRFLVCDVMVDENSGYVLYSIDYRTNIDTITRGNNGVWSVSHTCEIYREYDEKSLRSGQILPNNRLRLVFGGIKVEVEEWSFADNSPRLLSRSMPFGQRR